jgi:hypothetical protein
MEFKPKLTLRSMMVNGAIMFGLYAGAMLYKHDLDDGLWSFAVCLALVLGLLPAWLTGHNLASKPVEPEKYSLFGK